MTAFAMAKQIVQLLRDNDMTIRPYEGEDSCCIVSKCNERVYIMDPIRHMVGTTYYNGSICIEPMEIKA